MFVHFGNHYYGKVDVVPNVCYVATRFFHVNFIPLVPLGSCIIVAGTEAGNQFKGVKTSLSLKSILVAWLRAGLYIFVACSVASAALLTAEQFSQPGRPWTTPLIVWAIASAAAVVLWLTYRLNRASYARALELGTELGLDEAAVNEYLAPPIAIETESAPEPEGWERYR
jgi:hypothetical protein